MNFVMKKFLPIWVARMKFHILDPVIKFSLLGFHKTSSYGVFGVSQMHFHILRFH